MKNYMYDLLCKIDEDKGKTMNYLIETEVLSKNFIIKKGIETKNSYILYNIALYIKELTKEDINKIAEAIIKIGDLETLYEFAGNIPNAALDKIVDKIIETEESKYIFRLAICIKDKNEYIQRLTNAIIKLKEAEYIYLYARDLSSNLELYDIYKLQEAIIKTNDLEYIYEFVKDIKNCLVEELVLAIVKSENEEYINKIKQLPTSPKDIELMIERVRLEKQSEDKQLAKLYALIKMQEIARIEYNKDIYRNLFVETEAESKTIEEEIKHKKRVLTSKQREEQNKPQFPGITKK